MNISVQQLEYIVAVDSYRHYVTAAEKSFVTQPNLSMQIKKLEEELGVQLFDRSKQPIIPTPIGEKIIEQARIVLGELKKMEEIVGDYQGQIKGELVVGIIPTLAPYLLPLFVGDFLKQYPDVRLVVQEKLTQEIIQDLKKDKMDIGIIVTPVQDRSIKKQVLFYEAILLFGTDYQLQERVDLRKQDLSNIWLLKEGHCFRNQMINLCASSMARRDMQFEYVSGSTEGLKNLVLKEGGATLLPELAAKGLSKKESQLLTEIGPQRPYREVSLVQSRMQVKAKLVSTFSEQLLVAVPDEMRKKKVNVIDWE